MTTLVISEDVGPLYELNQNCVLVQYSEVFHLPGVGLALKGKVYRFNDGDGVRARELFDTLAAEGKKTIVFNADERSISDANC